MTTNRRFFIKQSSLALVSLAGVPDNRFLQIPLPPAQEKPDEAYWSLVRKQFPLSTKKIFLNNGTMGPSPYPVIDTVHKVMADTDEQGSYGGWESASKKIAAFVGADEGEIALTSNVTQGINIMCWGLPLQQGDEVILSTQEHAGGALPWLNRAYLEGIVVKTFAPALTADETMQRIQKAVTPKTKVLAIPHIPCTQGQVLPVKEICAWGKSKGLFVVIDGAHGPGMIPLNLHEMGCDAYASCCHKWLLGPKGTGFVYIRKEQQATFKTLFAGAGSDTGKWNMSHAEPQFGGYAETAHKYYYGTLNNALYKGVEAAIDFMNQIGKEVVYQRVHELGGYTQKALQNMAGDRLELVTPTEDRSRGAVTAFRIKGTNYKELYEALMKEKIVIRMVPENDVNCLRVSTHIYNNKQEVDQLVEVLKKII